MSATLETREKLPLLPFGDGAFDPYRLRVGDYEKMVELGIFGEDAKIELWEGVLVTPSPKAASRRTPSKELTELSKKR